MKTLDRLLTLEEAMKGVNNELKKDGYFRENFFEGKVQFINWLETHNMITRSRPWKPFEPVAINRLHFGWRTEEWLDEYDELRSVRQLMVNEVSVTIFAAMIEAQIDEEGEGKDV